MNKKKIVALALLTLLCGCTTKPTSSAGDQTQQTTVIKALPKVPTATPTVTPTATPVPTPEYDIDPTEPAINSGGYSGRTYGSAGRVRVPAVGIDTALYWVTVESTASGTPASGQGIVDAYDSAAYLDFNGYRVIADHAHQGFSGIVGLPVGTEIYIDNFDGTTSVYHVYASFQSDNTDGKMMYNGAFSYDGINLYTCLDNSGNGVWVLQAN